MLAVVTVFSLLGGALWILRRQGRLSPGGFSGRAASGPLQAVGRLALTPQHCLHLVRVEQRTVLIVTHAAGVSFEPSVPAFGRILEESLRPTGAAS
ncbi:MAG: flagellar biosynthetic protein FliO [Candidatus Solibacter usitatus]|nr:flagellar biosynthetic protein FliO [Candidatus Solibacter usitatus]